jgi:hypothetical protein
MAADYSYHTNKRYDSALSILNYAPKYEYETRSRTMNLTDCCKLIDDIFERYKEDVSCKLSQKEEIIYHHSIGECSILSVDTPLYILVKEPKTTGTIYGSDPIRTPLNIGYNLTDILTPNLYSKEFIDNIKDSSKYKNPFTNEKVITYIPLTSNPLLIEEKMKLIIGKCQYKNHLVNVYISIMINGLIKYPWMKDNEEIIIEHLRELIQNITSLSVSIDNSKGLTFYEKLMSLTNKLDKLSHCEKVTIDSIIEKCFSVDLDSDDESDDDLIDDDSDDDLIDDDSDDDLIDDESDDDLVGDDSDDDSDDSYEFINKIMYYKYM